MKRIIALIAVFCVTVTLSACGAEEKTDKTLETEKQIEEIIEEFDSSSQGLETTEDTASLGSLTYSIDVPKRYKEVFRGRKVYIYDSKGNSLIISKEKTHKSFAEYDKKDVLKIVGSSIADLSVDGFKRIKVSAFDAIKISFTSEKDSEKLYNYCYIVNCGDYSVRATIQSRDKNASEKLVKTFEEIEL